MMICRIAHAHYPPPDYLSRLTKKYSIALPFCGKQDPPIISSAYEDGSIVSKTGFRWRGPLSTPLLYLRAHVERIALGWAIVSKGDRSYELRVLFRDLLDSRRQVAAATIKTNTAMYISSVEPSPPSGEMPNNRSMKSMTSSFFSR